MTAENAIRLLNLLGIHNAMVVGEWCRASCPLAFHRHKSGKDANPSFGIHVDPHGKSGYSCFGCNIKGADLSGLLDEIVYALQRPERPPPEMNLSEAYKAVDAENEIGYYDVAWSDGTPEKQFEEWPAWWLESFQSVARFPQAKAYVEGRGVPLALALDMDLKFDPMQNMIGFPYYNIAGRFAGMRGRSIFNVGNVHYDYTCNKVNNAKLVLLGEHLIDWSKPVVICEGEFDRATIMRVYSNTVANLTASLSAEKLKTLEMAVSLVGFWDSDKAGEMAAEKMHKRFGSVYCDVEYPEHDPEQKFDPNKLPLSIIRKMLAPLVPLI